MVIRANSEKVRRLRKNIAELLVAQAPNSRAIQDIAVRCGVKNVRYPFRNEDCVLCGRCVRVCRDLFHANAIGFVGRGKNRRIDSPFGNLSESCIRCRTGRPLSHDHHSVQRADQTRRGTSVRKMRVRTDDLGRDAGPVRMVQHGRGFSVRAVLI